jgi:hypothetical protein
MADLTANFDRPYMEPAKERCYAAGAIHIYKGDGLMVLRGTGYAVKMANTALGQFIGVATEEVDNSGGSAGDLNVKVRTGVQLFSKGTAAITDIMTMAGAVDSDTVTAGEGSKVVNVGRIVGLKSTTHVWVDTDDHSLKSQDS